MVKLTTPVQAESSIVCLGTVMFSKAFGFSLRAEPACCQYLLYNNHHICSSYCALNLDNERSGMAVFDFATARTTPSLSTLLAPTDAVV